MKILLNWLNCSLSILFITLMFVILWWKYCSRMNWYVADCRRTRKFVRGATCHHPHPTLKLIRSVPKFREWSLISVILISKVEILFEFIDRCQKILNSSESNFVKSKCNDRWNAYLNRCSSIQNCRLALKSYTVISISR